MKGVKKCYGLLLLLSIMLGLSLNVSSDVNALKHDVQYLPLASQSAYTAGHNHGLNGNPRFNIHWSRDNKPSSDSFFRNRLHYFNSSLLNDRCTFIAHSSSYYSLPSIVDDYVLDYTLGFDSYNYNYRSETSYSGSAAIVSCRQNTPFGTLLSSSSSNLLSHPNFDDSSLVNIPLADRLPYTSLPPYYYDYDSMYIHDHAIDTNTGLTYDNSLKPSTFIGFAPNKFSTMTIPLGKLNEDVTGPATQGRNFTLSGVFDFSGSGNYFNWNPDLDSSSYFRLRFSGLTEAQSVTDTTVNSGGASDCTTNFVSLPSQDFYQLQYTCSVDMPVTFYIGQLWFSLEISSGNQNWLFDTNADWSFGSTWFVTDNDDTPGGTWGYSPTGNNLSSAPGSASSMIPADQDFFTQLSTLFNFGFFNPFQPLFNLFADDQSCAHIPTVAGMIHSPDTTVCHFFDSGTRNILTPVFGLASSMLIFGFAVRWLGASSGNFFEDAGSHETRHFRLSSRGVIKS